MDDKDYIKIGDISRDGVIEKNWVSLVAGKNTGRLLRKCKTKKEAMKFQALCVKECKKVIKHIFYETENGIVPLEDLLRNLDTDSKSKSSWIRTRDKLSQGA